MAFNLMTALVGSKKERDVRALLPILHMINAKEGWALSLADADFPAVTASFKARLASGEALDDMLPEAFALVREAARRVLGERPFDSQMMGGIVLHQGKIVEMKTGEGKTLSSVASVYLNALPGKGVHVVTVNDYLAERDSAWMGQIHRFLGLSVGCVLSKMDNDARKAAYACDITYGTNNELGFDYLRDNMSWEPAQRVQRGHHYCVVDEIDSILIDEARTPLIISGPSDDDTAKVSEVNRMSLGLEEVRKNPDTGEYPREEEGEESVGDFRVDEKSKRIMFTSQGLNRIEEQLQKRSFIQGSLFDERNFEYVHYFTQAVRARVLFEKDVDYVVQDGMVQIVDEFTGRILHGRRYSDGLHEAIEAKERIKVARRNRTLATITFQNYFRLYTKIAGMTGTADTEAPEFNKIYNLDVVVIPSNRPIVREDLDDLVFLNEADKFDAICTEIAEIHAKGQPILVGTVSIEKSEKLSGLLTRRGIRHEVLNAKNHAREAVIIAEAGSRGAVTIATNMAGRGTDIKLGGNPEFRARRRAGSEASPAELHAALEAEYASWRADYEEIKSLGGLYVLGTERHESRRIDNQLRGRSGRQGDPGKSVFFLSLDDDLMRLFGGENFKSLMSKVGMKPGEPIYHPLLNRTIENAQKKVEERNFEIRKHLLEYDDVLNKQRGFIYQQRDDILKAPYLAARIRETGIDMVDTAATRLSAGLSGKKDEGMDPTEFSAWLLEQFGLEMPPQVIAAEAKRQGGVDALRGRLAAALDADMAAKAEFAGADNLNQFIRFQYLQAIDNKWLDHLDSMEALREAVYLRSYAQKNPLLEYKIEGSSIFEEMVDAIRESIATRIYRVRIQHPEAMPARAAPRAIVTAHEEQVQFNGTRGAGSPGAGAGAEASAGTAGMAAAAHEARREGSQISRAAAPDAATVVRQGEKVGRNDPCPCGSGKKFKHCHGA